MSIKSVVLLKYDEAGGPFTAATGGHGTGLDDDPPVIQQIVEAMKIGALATVLYDDGLLFHKVWCRPRTEHS